MNILVVFLTYEQLGGEEKQNEVQTSPRQSPRLNKGQAQTDNSVNRKLASMYNFKDNCWLIINNCCCIVNRVYSLSVFYSVCYY